MSLAEAALVRSVEVGHHLLFGEGLEVVDVKSLGLKSRASVRGNQLFVQVRSNRKFWKGKN
jgi:hypothetical protein